MERLSTAREIGGCLGHNEPLQSIGSIIGISIKLHYTAAK